MALVEANGVAEAAQRFLQLLGERQLVPQQRVGVFEAWVHLYGPCEELNGDVVLPLQTETVSSYTPGLWGDKKIKIQLYIRFYFFNIDNTAVKSVGSPLVSFCPCQLGL